MVSCIVLLVSCIINIANGHNVTLYSIFNNDNQTLQIDVLDSCVNIPGSFLALNGGVSGVNTQGICTVVYSLVNCKGHVFVLKLGIDEHYDLKRYEWDNLPQSIGPCVMRRFQKEVLIERHDSLHLTIVICTLITVINAGMYFNYLRNRSLEKKRDMQNRSLPRAGNPKETSNETYIYDIGLEETNNDCMTPKDMETSEIELGNLDTEEVK